MFVLIEYILHAESRCYNENLQFVQKMTKFQHASSALDIHAERLKEENKCVIKVQITPACFQRGG